MINLRKVKPRFYKCLIEAKEECYNNVQTPGCKEKKFCGSRKSHHHSRHTNIESWHRQNGWWDEGSNLKEINVAQCAAGTLKDN